jgi:hypothetical protein
MRCEIGGANGGANSAALMPHLRLVHGVTIASSSAVRASMSSSSSPVI